jgi:hypothetical protein
MALFGSAPKRPLDYSGSAGLLWAVNGGRLVKLHRDWAQTQFALGQAEAGTRPLWATMISQTSPLPEPPTSVDKNGNVFGGFATDMDFKKFAKN